VLICPASFLSVLKAIYQWVDGATRQNGPAQSFSTTNSHPAPNLNTRTTSSNNQEREEIPTGPQEVNLEETSIHFLCASSTHPNWTQIVSTRNDYGQTLAHIAVTLGYFRLLQHLFRWQIDLNIVDSMGFSPLHYAYLFKQEECANILIHSGVDRFILDDLGRSPADLGASLEVRLRSIMDVDVGGSTNGAPPIECDTEMPDEAGKLFAKQFLIQQWMREGEDARMCEVPLSSQSQESSGPPALGSADEKVWGVPYDRSSPLVVRTPKEHSTPIIAEEIDLEALIEPATPPHIIRPPSPISGVSPQPQKANIPSSTDQYLTSYPLYPEIDFGFEPSVFSTTTQGYLFVSATSGDIREQNSVKGEQRSSSVGTSVARQRIISSGLPPAAFHDRSRMEEITIGAYEMDFENAAFEAVATLTGVPNRLLLPIPPCTEKDLRKLKAHLFDNHASREVVDSLDEVFKDGVTIEALESRLTREQCEGLGLRDGKRYQILLERVEGRVVSETKYRCRLCPSDAGGYKNHRGALRHLSKNHFGLSFKCHAW